MDWNESAKDENKKKEVLDVDLDRNVGLVDGNGSSSVANEIENDTFAVVDDSGNAVLLLVLFEDHVAAVAARGVGVDNINCS